LFVLSDGDALALIMAYECKLLGYANEEACGVTSGGRGRRHAADVTSVAPLTCAVAGHAH